MFESVVGLIQFITSKCVDAHPRLRMKLDLMTHSFLRDIENGRGTKMLGRDIVNVDPTINLSQKISVSVDN
ncbi:hypothetical protein KIN20_004186 [Parelaphostrongylus tenuis]|uniref:Uncharacterized protein n=1 Tax=Parelaphostrongylus tenuis TaxID=148309 RepID=A0AAD5QE93_PARTN|nr:hypothetical protein KIN20_004186 [Parelaphostrongylus tenuis]